jgi:hypothetical protein
VTMKSAVLWVATPCSSEGAGFLFGLLSDPEGGGDILSQTSGSLVTTQKTVHLKSQVHGSILKKMAFNRAVKQLIEEVINPHYPGAVTSSPNHHLLFT